MDLEVAGKDLSQILVTEAEIQSKVTELAKSIDTEYQGKDLLVIGVLKGAVMFMADLPARIELSANIVRFSMRVESCLAQRRA